MNDDFTRRTPSAWGEGAGLKDEILQAASRQLAALDDERDLSLRAVAREVGISAPSIYLHFADRAALVNAVSAQTYRDLAAALRAARLGAGDDPAEAVRAMAHRYCTYVTENRATQRLLFRLDRVPTTEKLEHAHPIVVIHDEWREAAAAASPDPDPVAARRTATLLWISVHGLVNLTIAHPAEVDEEQISDTVDLLVTQLLKV